MRHAIPLLLAALLALPAAASEIQRRSPREIADAVPNSPGEVTYDIDSAGALALRVGTSDAGTLVASDPCAVHFAPRRALGDGEWSATPSAGVTLRASDGAFRMAAGVVHPMPPVTNTLRIAATAPGVAIASARPLAEEQFCRFTEIRNDDGSLTLRAVTQYGPMGQEGYCYVTGLVVQAWASDRRSAVWDATMERVTLRDSMGGVEMSGLRKWVADRYDPQTAAHWSEHPATETVRLDGRLVRFDRAGLLRAVATTNALSLYSGSTEAVRLTADVSEASDALRITGVECGASNVAVTVSTTLAGTPSLAWCDDIRAGNWRTLGAEAQASGAGAWTFTFAPPAETAFFRAVVGAGSGRPRLSIQDCDLWIDGRRYERETWTFTTTNAVTITRSVLVETAP